MKIYSFTFPLLLRIIVMLTITQLLSSCDHVCLFSIHNDDEDTIFLPIQVDRIQSPYITVMSIEPVSPKDVSSYILSDFLSKGLPVIKGMEKSVDFFTFPNMEDNVSTTGVSVISGHEMNTKFQFGYSRHRLKALWSKGRHTRVFNVQPYAFPLLPQKCAMGSLSFSICNLADHPIYVVIPDSVQGQLHLREIREGEIFNGRTVRIMRFSAVSYNNIGNDRQTKEEFSPEKILIVDILCRRYISIETDRLPNMGGGIKRTQRVLVKVRHISPSHVDIEVKDGI